MIETIIFMIIGFVAIYILYRIMKKEIIEGKCASCESSKSCKSKKCN